MSGNSMKRIIVLFSVFLFASSCFAQFREISPSNRSRSYFIRLPTNVEADSVLAIDSLAVVVSKTYDVWNNMTMEVDVRGSGTDFTIIYESALLGEENQLTRFVTEVTTANITADTRVIITSNTISNPPAKFRLRITGVAPNRQDTTVLITMACSNPNQKN